MRKSNNIFLEVFSNVCACSLNYDRIVYNNFSARVGMMMVYSNSRLIAAFPLMMNHRFYISSNYIEIGIGTTIFSFPLNFGELGAKTAKGAIFSSVIGYKQKVE